jgi:hypothetical protein
VAKGLRAAIVLALALAGPAQAALPELRPPKWADLTTQQQMVLAPLVGDWDDMEDARRRKWLGVAARFHTMSPEEQQRLQARMREWARLTPEQRLKARQRYRELQAIPPEQREAVKQKWQEYENLSEDDKRRLKEAAGPKSGAKPGLIVSPAPLAAPAARKPEPPVAAPALPGPAPAGTEVRAETHPSIPGPPASGNP